MLDWLSYTQLTDSEINGWIHAFVTLGCMATVAAMAILIMLVHQIRVKYFADKPIWFSCSFAVKSVIAMMVFTKCLFVMSVFVWHAYRLVAIIEIVSGVWALVVMSVMGMIISLEDKDD